MKKINRKSVYIVIILIVALITTLIYKEYQSPSTQNRVFGVTYMTMNNPFMKLLIMN